MFLMGDLWMKTPSAKVTTASSDAAYSGLESGDFFLYCILLVSKRNPDHYDRSPWCPRC